MSCDARQYGDEMKCGRCGLSWDTNDPDPPACGKKIDRRAIPDRRVTNAVKRIEVVEPPPGQLPEETVHTFVPAEGVTYAVNPYQAVRQPDGVVVMIDPTGKGAPMYADGRPVEPSRILHSATTVSERRYPRSRSWLGAGGVRHWESPRPPGEFRELVDAMPGADHFRIAPAELTDAQARRMVDAYRRARAHGSADDAMRAAYRALLAELGKP